MAVALGAFLLLWIVATSCGSFASGWRELAKGHPARRIDPAVVWMGGDGVSLKGGWMPFTYQHTVRVRADASGVTVVQGFPFRAFAPAMHLRWADVLSCTEERRPGRTDAVLRVRDSKVRISIHDGEELLRRCRQNPGLAAPKGDPSVAVQVNDEEHPEILKVGGEVTAPVVVRRQEPVYDDCNLERVRISGPLVAQAVIDATGNVREVRISKAVHPCLDRAFRESLFQWKFRPAERRGLPVSVRMDFTANINVR